MGLYLSCYLNIKDRSHGSVVRSKVIHSSVGVLQLPRFTWVHRFTGAEQGPPIILAPTPRPALGSLWSLPPVDIPRSPLVCAQKTKIEATKHLALYALNAFALFRRTTIQHWTLIWADVKEQ